MLKEMNFASDPQLKCYSGKEELRPFLLYKIKIHGFVLPLFSRRVI